MKLEPKKGTIRYWKSIEDVYDPTKAIEIPDYWMGYPQPIKQDLIDNFINKLIKNGT